MATTLGAIALVILVATLVREAGGGPGLVAIFAVLGLDAIAFVSMAVLIERNVRANRVALVLAVAGPLIVLAFCGFAIGAHRYLTHGPDDSSAVRLRRSGQRPSGRRCSSRCRRSRCPSPTGGCPVRAGGRRSGWRSAASSRPRSSSSSGPAR